MKFLKRLYGFIGMVIVLSVSAVTVSAENTQKIVDQAELLSPEDEEILQVQLSEIAEKYSCDVAVVTVESCEGTDIQTYTEDYYYQNGYGYGEDIDGIILLVAMEERQFHLATRGEAIQIFTDYGLECIDNLVVPYLSEGAYFDAFTEYAYSAEDLLREYKDTGIAYGEEKKYIWSDMNSIDAEIDAYLAEKSSWQTFDDEFDLLIPFVLSEQVISEEEAAKGIIFKGSQIKDNTTLCDFTIIKNVFSKKNSIREIYKRLRDIGLEMEAVRINGVTLIGVVMDDHTYVFYVKNETIYTFIFIEGERSDLECADILWSLYPADEVTHKEAFPGIDSVTEKLLGNILYSMN